MTEEEKAGIIEEIFYKNIQRELESDNLEYFITTINLPYKKIGESWVREAINEKAILNIFMSKLNKQ